MNSYLNIILAILYGCAIIISGSRIGIIVFFIVPIIVFFQKKRCNSIIKVGILISLGIIIFVLYYLRPESANGRLLIWLSSLEAFKDAPWFGHGEDFFQRLYMFYQAQYLQLNPDSKFVMLADTVQFPFNEYVRVILNWGLVGFCLIIFTIIWFCRKCIVEFNDISLTIATIAILSLTSYPFSYPFTWIVICFSLLYAYGKHSFYFAKRCKVLAFLVIIFAIVNVNKMYSNYKMECMWCFADKTNDIKAYDNLYIHLKENPYFLYNYSVRLFIAGDISESKKIALECRKKYADYDLELLIGDIYYKENNYDEALMHYNLCANMCPCRFIPIYQKFLVSIKTNNKIQASLLAHEIIEKQIKVPSQAVTIIKMQAANYLNTK
ncbi:O-antigen ligase [uncultured Muribaculum sp.]|uniref:O-antigen ligase family protein n=1 Tax=uncultured Muribaculum sp. TaxID=1918613 RepID=UPI0026701391|nr:O-antigen ligase family protein [uncultured Muribaculum sp.]